MDSSYLTGPVPRIEAKPEHLELISKARTAEAMMLDYPHARRLEQNGVDLSELDAKVILTSTIPDEELEEWFPERELALAERIGADAIVPCDRPVYDRDSRAQRIETIQTYVADLSDIVPRFQAAGVETVPLVKGETEFERGLCYNAFDELGCSRVAYYCVQYFSYGFRYQALLDRIQRISLEYNPDNMMLIGFQSENLVSEFPPCITGVAGQRWLRKSNPRNVSIEKSALDYDRWSRQVTSALCIGQPPLHAFEDARGWA
ncbi:hypothetical protein HUG10_11755 [Halorarum halophilum]|uniref:Uncharacterized protein n=1 Tax=Halorarum halophilum TaxID=2743090 RepID=A0A7D5L2U3_9EURY|nr:hypothetical protein [Halobaculum halophilum]QLG28183.1 hypothetical protein HUG10_11755 [Halobaculum halophilum]